MRHLILLTLFLTSTLAPILAQTTATQPQKLRVITRNLEPFSFEQDKRRVGFAAELWDNVAREAGFEYEVAVTDTAKNIIAAVQNKTADVGVGAISITADREKVIDFSQPFYESGLDILIVGGSGGFSTVWQILSNLLSWQILGGVAALIVVMLIVSHLVWMYEHKINSEMWPEKYSHGMWESFWWSISIFLVGGADNKGPVGVGGRIVAIVWMLLSIVAIALLTASLSAALTVNSLQGDISGPRDLPNKTVATIGGSAAETWLQNHGCKVSTFPDINACIDALKKGSVKAVVFDAPILKYALKNSGDDKLMTVGNLFDRNNYGFALQQDSPLRETINQALLSLHEQGVTDALEKRWFGDDQN